MADMFAPLVAQLKANPKTIVFTEGNDPRILEAAAKLLAEGVLKVVMVGNEAECKAAAAAGNFDISAAEIIDPENYAGFDEMVNTMVELRKGKQTAEECTALLKKSNYFGTMLVKMGKADCLLGGATYSTADTIRPALQLVKTKKGAHLVSSCFILDRDCGEEGLKRIAMGDCAVNIDYTDTVDKATGEVKVSAASKLAEVAVETARTAALFGSTFFCFVTWDLSQLLFAGWAGFEVFRFLCGGVPTRKRRGVWLMIVLAIALNALLVPFNVTYGLLMSPFLCILLPLTVLILFAGTVLRKTFLRRLLLCGIALGCLWSFHTAFVDNPVYRANYSHFSEAMKAKVKFKNVKPSDPSKLNYDARMMWTPSMHSATWNITVSFFPSFGSLPFLNSVKAPSLIRQFWNYTPVTLGILFLLFVVGGLFTPTRRALLRDLPRSAMPLLFLIGFLIGFVFIVRYHEFVIIYLALSLPLAVQAVRHGLRTGYRPRNRIAKTMRGIAFSLVVLALLVELTASLGGRRRAYSADASFVFSETYG